MTNKSYCRTVDFKILLIFFCHFEINDSVLDRPQEWIEGLFQEGLIIKTSKCFLRLNSDDVAKILSMGGHSEVLMNPAKRNVAKPVFKSPKLISEIQKTLNKIQKILNK